MIPGDFSGHLFQQSLGFLNLVLLKEPVWIDCWLRLNAPCAIETIRSIFPIVALLNVLLKCRSCSILP